MSEELPHELLIAYLVDKTGWTYQELTAQPEWLLQTLMLMWKLEAEHQNNQQTQ